MNSLVEPGSVVAILNPTSGGGKTLKLSPQIIETLKKSGLPFFVYTTTGMGDAETRAHQFSDAGAGAVIAVGGDGTINEVANGLIKAGNSTPMGMIHAGRGGDLVRTTGTPQSVQAAIDLVTTHTRRQIDAGLATFSDGTSRYFLNIAGLGFDAEVARRAAQSCLPGSQLPYLSSLALSMANYSRFTFTISVDHRAPFTTRAIFVSVANGKYLAGGFKFAPMADIHDGKLDLAIIGDVTRRELVKQLPNVYRGTHVNHPAFRHEVIESVHISSEEVARVQLDGELSGYAPVTFSVAPAALTIAG